MVKRSKTNQLNNGKTKIRKKEKKQLGGVMEVKYDGDKKINEFFSKYHDQVDVDLEFLEFDIERWCEDI